MRTFIDTTNVGENRWGPPLVDEGWHAICQANYKVVEREEWENLRYKLVELNKSVNVRNSSAAGQRRSG